ncbi:uncharacterized protein LOC135397965 [Ornithodoros turicata]|uniref:uncharacterized protein LOC135397965 n=1 Tax=Ornithodoros turicata TaxID=34597 RepID=UPI003138CC97
MPILWTWTTSTAGLPCEESGMPMGHVREVRRARKKSKNATLDTLHLEEAEDRTDRARFTRLAVNGHWVRFKIDSGAEVTVVPEDLPWVPELLDPEDVSLTGPGGQALQIRGSFSATPTWKDRTAQQRVYVLSSLSTPLLGLPAIEALGVFKFVEGVSAVKRTQQAPMDSVQLKC